MKFRRANRQGRLTFPCPQKSACKDVGAYEALATPPSLLDWADGSIEYEERPVSGDSAWFEGEQSWTDDAVQICAYAEYWRIALSGSNPTPPSIIWAWRRCAFHRNL